jgi:hypothetical protein
MAVRSGTAFRFILEIFEIKKLNPLISAVLVLFAIPKSGDFAIASNELLGA